MCLSRSCCNFWKPWCRNFIFGVQVHLQVKFVHQDHRVGSRSRKQKLGYEHNSIHTFAGRPPSIKRQAYSLIFYYDSATVTCWWHYVFRLSVRVCASVPKGFEHDISYTAWVFFTTLMHLEKIWTDLRSKGKCVDQIMVKKAKACARTAPRQIIPSFYSSERYRVIIVCRFRNNFIQMYIIICNIRRSATKADVTYLTQRLGRSFLLQI